MPKTVFQSLRDKRPLLLSTLHNQYLVLRWDFSCVDPFGSLWTITSMPVSTLYYRVYLAADVRVRSRQRRFFHSIANQVMIVRKVGDCPVFFFASPQLSACERLCQMLKRYL